MDKTVKTPYLESSKYVDGCINQHAANLEDSDYITDYGIHTVDKLPDWYNDTPMELYIQDWIMTNELNEDGDGTSWYSLDTKEGETRAFYTPREKFKQMKL